MIQENPRNALSTVKRGSCRTKERPLQSLLDQIFIDRGAIGLTAILGLWQSRIPGMCIRTRAKEQYCYLIESNLRRISSSMHFFVRLFENCNRAAISLYSFGSQVDTGCFGTASKTRLIDHSVT